MRTFLLLACVTLGGCATNTRYFLPAGASEEDLQRQFAACKVEMAKTQGDWGATRDNCMRAAGYVRRS